MVRYREGHKIGQLRLVRYLGSGGNAEVWAADRADGDEVALKILNQTKPDSDAYKRFCREIATLRQLGSRSGILPLIDAHLPERPGKDNPAWLTMPIATPILAALADEPRLPVVVNAVATVAIPCT